MKQTEDYEEIIERVAAIDVGKAEVMCCVRVPDKACPGQRLQEVVPYSTMTRSLLLLSDRLAELGVTRVVMEATSDYWKPVFYALERPGRQVWLVNARDVKHVPGRLKTDRGWTRCGWRRSLSGRCCGRVSCLRLRSGGCGTSGGIALI